MDRKCVFYNINLDITDLQGVLARCSDFFKSERAQTIFFLNAHCFNTAQKNREYRDAINSSDLLLNDGVGIKIASLLSGLSLRENLNGTDLIPEILKLAAKKNKRVYFLGGLDGVAEKASVNVKRSLPGLDIAGSHTGFFGTDDEKDLIDKIEESGAELLIIGMGVPRQELWAVRNKQLLKKVKIIIAGGAILDFLSGRIKRAPLWLRKVGMEWLYRLYIEPSRMWKRYIPGNFIFFINLFKIRFLGVGVPATHVQAEEIPPER